jgi:hypothetical protein
MEVEIGRICSTYKVEEECFQNFGGNGRRTEITRKT